MVRPANLEGFPIPLPEKQPHSWDELTVRQKRVARLVHEWMVHFVESTPGQAEQRERGPLSWSAQDAYRTPNVVLIDGTRGSGKTSVMLSLLDLWRLSTRDRLEAQEGTVARRALAPRVVSEDDRWKQQWLEEPSVTGLLFIPLKPLDLHPLPQDASLFAWIAGRLLKFAELDEEPEAGERADYIGPPQPIASWSPDVEHEPRSKRAWRAFIRDAASGWDSNLQQRKANLDPEAYAVELEQAEQARHTISDSWQRFVNDVFEDTRARLGRLIRPDARLVIPIDDADMNPERCVEVLNAVRVLWHPRVVFLLTGNSRLFIKMLRLQQYGALREKLHGGTLQRLEIQSLESRPTSHELAVQAYDKAIPPGQRFSLEELLPTERLALFRRSLYDTLKSREVGSPGAPPSEPEAGEARWPGDAEMDDYLRREGSPALASLLQTLQDIRYLREGLPMHLRRLRNLAYSMALKVQVKKVEDYREAGRGPVTPVSETARKLGLVYMLWWDAVENQPFSRASDTGLRNALLLETCERPLASRGAASSPDGRSSQRHSLRISTETPVQWRAFPVERFLGEEFASGEIRVTDKFLWRLHAEDTREAPRYLTALFLLALEVATDEDSGPTAAQALPQGLLAPHLKLSHRLAGSGECVDFFWPLPDWTTLKQLVAFESLWNARWHAGWRSAEAGPEGSGLVRTELGRLLLGRQEPGAMFDVLLRSFLESVLEAHRTEVSEPRRGPGEGMPPPLEELVRALFQEARALLFSQEEVRAPGGSGAQLSQLVQRKRAFAEWFLERAPLLAAPESGLPGPLAERFLRLWLDSADEGLRGLLQDFARRGRHKRAVLAFESLPKEARPESPMALLRRLDDAWAQRSGPHPWTALVEGPPSTRKKGRAAAAKRSRGGKAARKAPTKRGTARRPSPTEPRLPH